MRRRPNNFQIDLDSPQARNLAFWWNGGNTNHSSRNQRNVAQRNKNQIQTNTSNFPEPVMDPMMGRVFDFDVAADERFEFVDDANLNNEVLSPGGYTLTGWAYPTSNTTYQPVMGKELQYVLYSWPASPQQWAFWIWDGVGDWHITNSGITPTLNEWTFVCGMWEGGTTGRESCWVNGVEASGQDRTIGYSADAFPMGVGSKGESNWFWDGRLADVRIYDKALTPGEIWAMYDPATRWDLYWQPTKTYFVPAAAETNIQFFHQRKVNPIRLM